MTSPFSDTEQTSPLSGFFRLFGMVPRPGGKGKKSEGLAAKRWLSENERKGFDGEVFSELIQQWP